MPDNHTPCPVCSSASISRFQVPEVGAFQHCDDCGFIFAPEVESEDASLYDESFGTGNIHPTYRKTPEGYAIKNRLKLSKLLDQFEPYRQTGRILDIGCSAAFFMHLAQQRGWKANGVEIAPWAAKFSNEELGVEVYNGMLEDAAFADGTFDVVFSSHVLEHIRDPKSLLSEMCRVLRPGGLHVSVLPSQFASPSWRLRSRFVGDPPPKHTSFFDTSTFAQVIRSCGMEVLSCRYNVELMRLYELTLSKDQLKDRWQSKVAANSASGTPARESGWKPQAIAAFKQIANALGNALQIGDEIVCFARKPC